MEPIYGTILMNMAEAGEDLEEMKVATAAERDSTKDVVAKFRFSFFTAS